MTVRVTAPPQRRTATEELVGARDSARSASVDSARDLAAPGGSVQRRSRPEEPPEAIPTDDAVRATAASGLSGPGQPLPHQGTLQPLFGGHSLAGLRVYSDERAVDAADSLGAQAYTYQGRIALRPGASLSETAHESAHALLEQDGIAPREALGPEKGPHEQLAERVAQAASDGQPVASLLDEARAGSLPETGATGSVQRVIKINPPSSPTGDKKPLFARSIDELPAQVKIKLKYGSYANSAEYKKKFDDMLLSDDEYEFDSEQDLIFSISEKSIPAPNMRLGVVTKDPESKKSVTYKEYRELRKKDDQPIEQFKLPDSDLSSIANAMKPSWKDIHRAYGEYFDLTKPTNEMNCYEFALLLALSGGYLTQEDVSTLALNGSDVVAMMLGVIKSEAVLLEPKDYDSCLPGDIIFLNAPEFHTGICVGGNSVMQLGSNTGGVKQTTIDEMRKSYMVGSPLLSLTDTFMLMTSSRLGTETDENLAEAYNYLNKAPMFTSDSNAWISLKVRIDQGINKHIGDADGVQDYLAGLTLDPEGEQKLPSPLHRALSNFVKIKVGRAPRERWIGRIKSLAKQKAKPAPE